jgi:hypothetical protein
MSKELSPELKAQIEQEAEMFKKRPHYRNGDALSCGPQIYLKRGYIAGATEYAPYKVKLEQAKSIIERIVMDHDLGLEMSITFYREIKTFLDGK